MSVLDSIVVDFGEAAEEAGLSFNIGLDAALNGTDEDGNEITEFHPGDDAHILVQLPTGYVIERITYTSGEVVNNGVVSRSDTEERKFFPDEDEVSLDWWPLTITSSSFYGNTSSFTISEDKVVSDSPPVIANITYSFNAYSLTIIHPSIELTEEDDTWPVGVVIWAVEG